MDKTIQAQLRDIIYHKLGQVKQLYKATFNIDLGEIGPLMKAIQRRHDIVHRNGHDKEGRIVEITKEDVQQLITMVSNFITNIENQFIGIQIDDYVKSNNKNPTPEVPFE